MAKVKHWYGLLSAYNAIVTKDSGTLYNVYDEGAIYRGSVCIVRSGNTLNTTSTAQTKLGALTVTGAFYANGGLTATTGNFTGILNANTIVVGNTGGVSHLTFSRGAANYVTAPAGGSFAFIPNGKALAFANADLIVEDAKVYAGTNNYNSLGIAANRWSNMFSVLGNFSGLITANGSINSSGLFLKPVATTAGVPTTAYFGSQYSTMRNISVATQAPNLLYMIHTDPNVTFTHNTDVLLEAVSATTLFNGAYSEGIRISTTAISDATPYVLTVSSPNPLLTYFYYYGTLSFTCHEGWSGAFDVGDKFNSWKFEIQGATDSIWYTVLDRVGVSDTVNNLVVNTSCPACSANNSHAKAFRITIRAATPTRTPGTGYDFIPLSEIIYFNGNTSNIAGNALPIGGGTMKGSIHPSQNNTFALGNSTNRWGMWAYNLDASGAITATGLITGTGGLKTGNNILYTSTGNAINITNEAATMASTNTVQTFTANKTFSGLIIANGGINGTTANLSGNLSVDTITINNASAVSHLSFSRGSFNYLTVPTGGILGIITNGKGIGAPACDLIIADTQVYAGTNNYNSLGIAANRWANMYSVLGNFSGLITASGGLSGTTGAFSSTLTVGAKTTITSVGFGLEIKTADSNAGLIINAGTTRFSWIMAAQYNVGDCLEFTPSTVVGGTTFSNPVLKLYASGAGAFSNNLTVGGTLVVTGTVTASAFYEA